MRNLKLWLAVFCLLLACGGSDSTTGRQIVLQTALRSDPEIMAPFTTQTGWSVQLQRAAVSVGSLYYFDGEPAFVRRQPSLRTHFASLLGLSVARAHPGHYIAGMARGQMTTPAFADLFAGTSALPQGVGITGDYRSARFKLSAPTVEPAVTQLGGAVAMAQGVARQGEQAVHFKLSASFEEVARSVASGAVDGCVFEEADVGDDGVVTVTVVPHVWFNLVDFAEVTPGTAEAPTEVVAGSTARIAFALGVAQLTAYRFAYAPIAP